MCLSTPAKVVDIHEHVAKVSVGGTIFTAGLQLVEDVGVGDWVLLHTGFAIRKLDEQEALETLKILREIKDAQSR